ncbi:hypothetical protein [Streptomyces sp. NPDC057636]|uniref:hypothetical protein n=1 Tax=Streptomyces sp. NPDC057636 TaxID=3346189 RepID=UPI0036AFD7DB
MPHVSAPIVGPVVEDKQGAVALTIPRDDADFVGAEFVATGTVGGNNDQGRG